MKRVLITLFALVPAVALGACSQQDAGAVAAATAAPVAAAIASEAAAATAAALPVITMHKSPSCGCCGVWGERMQEAGFQVKVNDVSDIMVLKQQFGLAPSQMSCHTAEVGGYVIEGHVPAEDIKRLLAERPAAKGLVVPGMPAGSPGMEQPDGMVEPYTVELLAADGSTTPYAHHGGAAPLTN